MEAPITPLQTTSRRAASDPETASDRETAPCRQTAAGRAFDGRSGLTDSLGRPMRDLRISVTDRCNFRCTYCMPKELFGRDFAFLPRELVLTFEEIERLAGAFGALG